MPHHLRASFDDDPDDLVHARIDGLVGLAGALVVAVCAACIAGGALWTTRKPDPRADTVELSVGLETVRVKASWIRGRARAPSDPVELVAAFGDLAPGAPQELHGQPVLVTLAPADRSMAPADRPRHLYARFLTASSTPAEGGLIRRRFRAGTPFDGEDLLLAPPDGRAFAARCLDRTTDSPVTASCAAEMRFEGLDVQLRFAPAVLARWDVLVLAAQDRFGGS